MARFIILFLLISVLLIGSITFILGALRRFFVGSVAPQSQSKSDSPTEKVLYQKDDVVVLKGTAKEPERHKI